MGGSAFASKNLITPRIPPDLYEHVRDHLVLILRQHFNHVDSAVEAPGKKDHGDIDILVAEPVDPKGPPKSDQLATWIGAPHWRSTPGSDTFNFAVPWPGSTEQSVGEEEEASSSSMHFIQVDIHICPSAQSFSWHLFFQAHGDLWNMIGSIIRRFGLTCNDHGLFLRIAEVEPYNKQLSRVLLTKDPVRVLQYLGLDEHRYWTRFRSWDEMMDFATSCRFHSPNVANSSSSISLQARLKASDRQRLRKRPAFSHWIDTYLPMHSEDPVGHSAHLTREEVVVDAKAWFGEMFTLEFDDRKAQGMREVRVRKLWTDIRRSLPIEGCEVGLVMKGLKLEIEKETDEEDHVGGGDVGLNEARRCYKEGDFEIVNKWAVKNWKNVEERQKVFKLE